MELEKFIDENLMFGRALIDLEHSKLGSNPLWTGFVATNKGEIPAYIKKCNNPNGLYIEVVTALLGLWLKIPIPRPIIVLVEPNHPQIPVGKPTFLFGSEKYEMPSLERFLRDKQLSEECMLEYKGLPSILAFDELIANPDRNNSNILFNGESFRFIDHEKAFNQYQDPRSPINETIKIGTISDIVQHYKGGNDIYTHRLMTKIKQLIQADIAASDCDELLVKIKSNLLLVDYNVMADRIKSFLSARHSVLAHLVQNAITQSKNDQQIDWIGEQ